MTGIFFFRHFVIIIANLSLALAVLNAASPDNANAIEEAVAWGVQVKHWSY